MAEHPHDASDPSSDDLAPSFVGERKHLPPRPRVRREATMGTFNDEKWTGGDAVPDATPSLTADQGYLLRDRPPPRTADDIAALIIDRDDARAALYRAHDDMWKMREDCAALRLEVGLTFKRFCDAATLASFLEQERDEARAEVGALTTERDVLKARLALLDSPELLERLADLEHWRWSGWEEYRAEKAGITHPNGERYTERWRRQGCTAYADLSESEKESDRVEARKGLAVIKAMMGKEAIGDS